MKVISLNGHPTTILRGDCPVVNQSIGGRDSLILACPPEKAEEYVLLRLAKTTLPIPKVAPAAPPTEEIIEVEGAAGPITVKVQSFGQQEIENLPEPQEGVVYLTSYVTAKAARELGRTDFWSSGPSVMILSEDGTTTIFGCLDVNRFE